MIENFPRFQIDEELYLVLRTICHYERSIASKYDLDFQQIYALQYLRRNLDARVTEVSLELELPMFTTSRLIDRLAARGFVKKDQDTKDRRNLHVHLEPKGEEILQAIENTSFERISQNSQNLTPEVIAQYVGLTEKLHILLGVTEHVIK